MNGGSEINGSIKQKKRPHERQSWNIEIHWTFFFTSEEFRKFSKIKLFSTALETRTSTRRNFISLPKFFALNILEEKSLKNGKSRAPFGSLRVRVQVSAQF